MDFNHLTAFLFALLCFYGSNGCQSQKKFKTERKLSWKDYDAKALFEEFWNWKLSDMPQFATFVGIHSYDDRLDDLSEDAYENRFKKCQSFMERANDLLPSVIDETDKINIEVLKYELQTYIDGYKLKGFYLPVNRLEGPQEDLVNVFDWMKKETKNDYNVMLKRLSEISVQIDQMIDLMNAGINENITYAFESVNNLNETIGRYVVEDPKKSSFYSFFADASPTDATPEDIESIKDRAQNIIHKSVTSAFEKLRHYMMVDYKPRSSIAVTTMGNGIEFYNQLIWFHVSAKAPPSKIHLTGLYEVKRISENLLKIIEELGYGNMSIKDFSDLLRKNSSNFYDTADQVMAAYQNIAYEEIMPRLPQIFKNMPEAKLKLKAKPSKNGPSAFYLSGSFDGSRPGVFYVNTFDPHSQAKYSMMTLSLHEGNPGHHLQTSYSIESPDFPYFRRVMDDRDYGKAPSRFPVYTYFIEGWALYAESLGFDMNLYDDLLVRYGHYSEEMFRACRLVVDTGIHALGWTRKYAIEFMLANTASTRHEIENEVDRYITWPGQALAYKMGQIRITLLRQYAEKELGKEFKLKEFHDIVLRSFGPMDLLDKQIKEWVKSLTSRRS